MIVLCQNDADNHAICVITVHDVHDVQDMHDMHEIHKYTCV